MIPFALMPFMTGVLLRVPHSEFANVNAMMEKAGYRRDFAGMDRDDPAFDLLTYRKITPTERTSDAIPPESHTLTIDPTGPAFGNSTNGPAPTIAGNP